MAGNGVDNNPVDIPVVVHGDIAEAHGFFQLRRQVLIDDANLRQGIEGESHRIRWRYLHARNKVRAHVHAQLYGSGKVNRDDILKIGVSSQRFRVGWTFVFDAPQTATGILVFVQSLTDPRLSPFSKDSVAVG